MFRGWRGHRGGTSQSPSVLTSALAPHAGLLVRQALRCQRSPRLLTLQIHFLNCGQDTKLISLSRHRLTGLHHGLPRFYQVSTKAQQYRRPRLLASLSQGPEAVRLPWGSPGRHALCSLTPQPTSAQWCFWPTCRLGRGRRPAERMPSPFSAPVKALPSTVGFRGKSLLLQVVPLGTS